MLNSLPPSPDLPSSSSASALKLPSISSPSPSAVDYQLPLSPKEKDGRRTENAAKISELISDSRSYTYSEKGWSSPSPPPTPEMRSTILCRGVAGWMPQLGGNSNKKKRRRKRLEWEEESNFERMEETVLPYRKCLIIFSISKTKFATTATLAFTRLGLITGRNW